MYKIEMMEQIGNLKSYRCVDLVSWNDNRVIVFVYKSYAKSIHI
jgi:hypothetical protein